MDKLKAAVVIPTFNKKERLLLTLESFRYQTVSPDTFEVLLVDDGSGDGTREMLKEWEGEFSLRYIEQNNKGRSAARNRGVEEARAELIIFCDDDMIAAPTFVEAHIAAHQERPCAAHGMIYNLPFLKFFKNPSTGEAYEELDGESLVMIRRYCIRKEEIKDISYIKSLSKKTLIEKNIASIFKNNLAQYQWLSFTGANSSCEKELLERAGMFDEGFGKAWGAEDFELGYRLYLQHTPFVYLEEGYNFHMMHARMDFQDALRKSNDKFYRMHPDKKIYFLPKLLSGEIKSIEEYKDYVNSHTINEYEGD